MNKNNKSLSENNAMLIEIASILYQVNDLSLALEMIIDTIGENFKIRKSGIAILNEYFDQFKITGKHGFSDTFVEQFVINPYELINGNTIRLDAKTEISKIDKILKMGDRQLSIEPDIRQLVLYPVQFHEKLIGFIVLASESQETFISTVVDQMLSTLSLLMGPVLFAFDPLQKTKNTFENIISKIIKDRVYEARLALNPISFSIFRLVLQEKMTNSLIFEDTIKSYQREFHRTLSATGDLIWLTADTAFFMYSNADLFESESLASELKKNLKQIHTDDQNLPAFSLKYACISYPQSGDNAIDIINSLWLKLFEEIYLMEQ